MHRQYIRVDSCSSIWVAHRDGAREEEKLGGEYTIVLSGCNNKKKEMEIDMLSKQATKGTNLIPSNWSHKWSKEEDERLLSAIETHGLNWTRIAEDVKTRDSGNSIYSVCLFCFIAIIITF